MKNSYNVSVVPYGLYCYDPYSGKYCTYGYFNEFNEWSCKILEEESNDEENFDAGLYDQCKCCGINMPNDEEIIAELKEQFEQQEELYETK